MKLYYSPGACSLSPHIVVRELDLPIELVRVDLKRHMFDSGKDFYRVNAHGYVPVLELDDGTRLSEGPAIVQYLADRKPELGLAPPNGSLARYELQQMLNFLTAEVHKGFHGVFYASVAGKYAELAKQKLDQRFAWIDGQLAFHPYLSGETFTISDAYLYALVGWASAPWINTYVNSGFQFGNLAHLKAWYERVSDRPAVRQALIAEGLQ
ncbi:glutathione transferase GstA [Burkholderia multivorans]|uniref:glutathione transferase GstA n=1 Tax=Burkholderia multivorans TaxID=87883 RepID=UPI0021BE725D|nr:glutathione transferase GstA [Burkholderia multivorans]